MPGTDSTNRRSLRRTPRKTDSAAIPSGGDNPLAEQAGKYDGEIWEQYRNAVERNREAANRRERLAEQE